MRDERAQPPHHAAKRALPLANVYSLLDFNPPLVGCAVSQNDFSFKALNATRQCVLNIPTAELAEQVVGCGNTTGAQVDKFAQFGLRVTPASEVDAPLIDACFASLECRVTDTRLRNRYNFFVLQVVKAWVRPAMPAPRTLHHLGYGLFMTAVRSAHQLRRDPHLARQQLVHRTRMGDLEQSGALLIVQLALQRDVALNVLPTGRVARL
jgi:flavin reductase (DIM6/NTAB) family NADH-FMN oxidoreductase RutF